MSHSTAILSSLNYQQPVPTSMLDRITVIIDAFESANHAVSLEQIRIRTGLPRSTAHRILVDLVNAGWLVRRDRAFMLGDRGLGAVGAAATYARIRIAAAEILHDLWLSTGMVVHLSVRKGDKELFLDKIGGPLAKTLGARVGASVPLPHGPGGRAMLALLIPEQVNDLLEPHTRETGERCLRKLEDLHTELARIRSSRGVAYETYSPSTGLKNDEIDRIACAVMDGDGTLVSLCVSGRSSTVNPSLVVPHVRRSATQLGLSLSRSV